MTLQELKAIALIIINATTAGEISPVRVGTMFDDILNYISESDDTIVENYEAADTALGQLITNITSFGGSQINSITTLGTTIVPNNYPVHIAAGYAPLSGVVDFSVLVLKASANLYFQVAYFQVIDNKIAIRSGNVGAWGVWNELSAGGGTGEGITVDAEMNSLSENPVQNKIITAEIINIYNQLTEKVQKISLLSVTTAPEATAEILGQKYYSFAFKGLNTCVSDIVIDEFDQEITVYSWEQDGTPENGIVYTFGGSNYVWNGVDLNELGAAPDLTPYSTTEEIDLKLDDKASVVTLQSITTAPVEAILDQYYYKLSVKSLYKYKLVGHTSDLSWQNVGIPKAGIIYVFGDANYVWNGVDLVKVDDAYNKTEIDEKINKLTKLAKAGL